MAVDGVEPPFVTTDHRHVVGQFRPWDFNQIQATMRRPPALQPLAALDDRILTIVIAASWAVRHHAR